MMIQAQKLRQARDAAGLTLRQMADLLDEDEASLRSLESGEAALDLELANRCSRVFGVHVERFLLDNVSDAPAPMLFRSLNPDVINELRNHNAHFGLGDFLRCVADVAELAKIRARKGATWRPMARVAELLGVASLPDDDPSLFRQAELLARSVRESLQLADAPIPSMIQLFERQLEVPIVWTDPDEIDANIDGASTILPTPAVLVNLVGGSDCWWRTRMTLAHELCHLLFDSLVADTSPRQMFMFSPHRQRELPAVHRAYKLPDRLERMERRANAFAAHLLAPGRSVRKLVARIDSTSEAAITLLRQHFSIGRVTAVNQLTNVFLLSKQERARMLGRSSQESLPRNHPDADVVRGSGPRCGILDAWVVDSLSLGWIGGTRARDYLHRSPTESLSMTGLPVQYRAPVLSESDAIRLRVYGYLGRSDRTAGWSVAEPVSDGERWRAQIYDNDVDGTLRLRGSVALTRGLDVIEAESSLNNLDNIVH